VILVIARGASIYELKRGKSTPRGVERAKGLYSLAPARLTLKGPPTEATTRLSQGLVCELTHSLPLVSPFRLAMPVYLAFPKSSVLFSGSNP